MADRASWPRWRTRLHGRAPESPRRPAQFGYVEGKNILFEYTRHYTLEPFSKLDVYENRAISSSKALRGSSMTTQERRLEWRSRSRWTFASCRMRRTLPTSVDSFYLMAETSRLRERGTPRDSYRGSENTLHHSTVGFDRPAWMWSLYARRGSWRIQVALGWWVSR